MIAEGRNILSFYYNMFQFLFILDIFKRKSEMVKEGITDNRFLFLAKLCDSIIHNVFNRIEQTPFCHTVQHKTEPGLFLPAIFLDGIPCQWLDGSGHLYFLVVLRFSPRPWAKSAVFSFFLCTHSIVN